MKLQHWRAFPGIFGLKTATVLEFDAPASARVRIACGTFASCNGCYAQDCYLMRRFW
ncbi:MAG: hypothetical protein ABI790_11535 [Betaproteobacteria bacterium]